MLQKLQCVNCQLHYTARNQLHYKPPRVTLQSARNKAHRRPQTIFATRRKVKSRLPESMLFAHVLVALYEPKVSYTTTRAGYSTRLITEPFLIIVVIKPFQHDADYLDPIALDSVD